MNSRQLVSLVALSCATTSAMGALLHVSPASPGGDGGTWSTASSNLVEVVRSASAGDVVWVAAGSYSGNVRIPSGVTVLGGFRGDETSAELRNPRRYATRLQLASNGLPTVNFLSGTDPSTLDGFRLVGLRGPGSVVTATNAAPRLVDIDLIHPGLGPGVFDGSSRPTWNFVECDVRIRGCHLVAAALADRAVVQLTGGGGAIEGSHFASNSVYPATNEPQSGVVVLDGASPWIERNWFAGNSAHHGGGVTVLGAATPLIRNNLFTDQSSNLGSFGGPEGAQGGSALFADAAAAPRFLHNTVTTRFGGAVRLSGTNGLIANNLFAHGGAGPEVAAISPLVRNGWIGPTNTLAVTPIPVTGVGGNVALAAPFASEPNRGQAFLVPGSAAVDAGILLADAGEVDFLGNPRSQGTGPDLGALESDGTTPILPPVPVFRVRTDGDDLDDGASWTTAKRTVGAALDEAVRVGGEVWVAGGRYAETGLQIGYLVSVYGGFDGTESIRPERVSREVKSVLDGSGAGRIAGQAGAAFQSGVLAPLQELSGFVFRNGRSSNMAGALLATGLRIRYNRFESNQVVGPLPSTLDTYNAPGGGALVLEGSYVAVEGNVFVGNSVLLTNRAGATGFPDPRQGSGGALLIREGGSWIRDNLFVGNSNRIGVGTGSLNQPAASGAAIGLFASAIPTRIENNTFLNNVSERGRLVTPATPATAVTLFRGRVSSIASGVLELRNNLFAFNSGAAGKESIASPTLRSAYNAAFANDDDQLPAGTSNVVMNPGFGGPGTYPRLDASSPLRDAGDPATEWTGRFDVEGRPRQIGGRVDIGAFEFDEAAPGIPVPVAHVRPDGDDNRDGRSWSAAKRSIQAAVESLGLGGGEVWVRGGDYRGPVRAGEFVRLFGGFSGSEVRREDRDWASNPTVIAAPLAGTGDGGPLVSLRALASPTVFSGFHVRGGIGQPAGGISIRGGGTVSGCNFNGNRGTNVTLAGTVAAGAIFHDGAGRLRVENSLFVTNSTSVAGGIIASQNGTAGLDLLNSTFQGNPIFATASLLRLPATPASTLANCVFVGAQGTGFNLGSIPPGTLCSSNLVWLTTVFSGGDPNGFRRMDPLLSNPAAGDFRPTEASPARDSADVRFPTSEPRDLGARLRGSDGRGDIGAFEYFPPPPADFAVAIDIPSTGSSVVALRATDVFYSLDNTNRVAVRAELRVDGTPVATNSVAGSRVIRWSAPLVGNHALVIRVWVDGFQPTDSAPVNVTVPVPAGDTPPVISAVSVLARGGALVAPVTVSVIASVSDNNGIQGAWRWFDSNGRLLRSGLALGSATTGPMEFLQAGTHTFRLWVQDRVGQTTETNVTVRIESPTRWTSNFGPDLVLRALNEAGVVAGSRRTDPVGPIPVRIEQGRVMALVAETDGPGEALGLNSSGTAVGTLRGVPALFRDSGPVRLTNLQGAAVAINASEQVVGTVLLPEGGTRPFRWENGSMTLLPIADGQEGNARAINDAGLVVGSVVDRQGRPQAVAWRQGVLEWLTTEAVGGTAQAVDPAGFIVGEADGKPVVWRNGVQEVLPGGEVGGAAFAISADGVIGGQLGSAPVLWVAGTVVDPLRGISGDSRLFGGFVRVAAVNQRGDLLAGSPEVYRLVHLRAQVPEPRLRLSRGSAPGSLRLDAGLGFQESPDFLEASDDFRAWQPVGTNVLSLELPADAAQRFFRMRRREP